MKIVEHAPEYADRLERALAQVDFEAPLLRSAPFVKHMFLSEADCRLYLLLGEDGDVIATLGSERVRARIADSTYDAAILSNSYSMRPGAFSFLYLQWMRSSEVGILFPGNALMRDMLQRQERWRAVPGLRTYWLNWEYPAVPGEARWKAAARPLARKLMRIDQEAFPDRIARRTAGELRVVEETRISEDMVQTGGKFGFRLDAGETHLNWRFSTELDYVSYRVFRLLRRERNVGYVVIGEWPNCLVVSHCDGRDPEELALGVILASSTLNRNDTRYRKVLLTSMHAVMQSVFLEFGFRTDGRDAPFAIAALGKRSLALEPGNDWLVNMDLGDSGTVAAMVHRA